MTPLRWVLLALAVVVAMVVASLTAEPDDWGHIVEWGHRRRADWVARAPGCPVLFGESLAIDADLALARAWQLARASDHEARERLYALRATLGSVTPEDLALLAPLAPAVEALHEASRAGVGPRLPDDDGVEWFDLTVVVDAALVAAHAPGVVAEQAVRHVLATLAVGGDLAASWQPVHQLVGLQFVERAVDACDDPWLDRLPMEQIVGLAPALAAADEALPVASELPAAIAAHMVEFLAGDGPVRAFDLGVHSPLQAWRHGFSLRRLGMARARDLVAAVRSFEAGGSGDEPWPERRARLAGLVAGDRASNRDMQFPPLAPVLDGEELRRRAATRLRLLRLAVAARAGLPLPRLADPFGSGPIVVEAGAEPVARSAEAKLWRRLAIRR